MTQPNAVTQSSIVHQPNMLPVMEIAADLVLAARHDISVSADVEWLAETVKRVYMRYGLVLQALAQMPALLADLARLQHPEATTDVLQALRPLLEAAEDHLTGIGEYLWAIDDPGPASCRTCGMDLGIFYGLTGWQHCQRVPHEAVAGERLELVEVDHEPDVRLGRPERPDWSAIEGEPGSGNPLPASSTDSS